VVVPGGDGAGVHVVAVVRGEPDKVRPGVEGVDDVGAGAGQEVRAPGWAVGNRRVREEGEVVLTARRVDPTTGAGRVLGEGLPRVTGILDQVHDRRVVEVRMVPVARDSDGRRAEPRDVVRLRRIGNARPVLSESILVRELRHVR